MSDTKPKLSIDDLLLEATKLVRDKIPAGLAATVNVSASESLLTGSTAGAIRSVSHFIDISIDGQCIHTGRAMKTMADEIDLAHKAIAKHVAECEQKRIEAERAEFDKNNVPDRFEASGIA